MKEILILIWPVVLIEVILIGLLIWDIIEERRKKNWSLPSKKELKRLYRDLKVVDDKVTPERLEEFREAWKETVLQPLLFDGEIIYKEIK